MLHINSAKRRSEIAQAMSQNDVMYNTASSAIWSSLGIMPMSAMSFVDNHRVTVEKHLLTQEAKRKWRKLFRKFYADALRRSRADDTNTNKYLKQDSFKKNLIKARPALATTEMPLTQIQIAGFQWLVCNLMPINNKTENVLPVAVRRSRSDFMYAYIEYVLVYDLYQKMKQGAPQFTNVKKRS